MRFRDSLFLAAQEGKFVESRLLSPLSAAWSAGSSLKNILYDRHWLPIRRLPIPVVSIGSLAAGGSGKTPLVHLLAKTLQTFGKTAILSRGYRAEISGLKLGDEMQMLKNRLPHCLVFVGKNRQALGKRAVEAGAQVALLDDGFQHRRLHRDIELLVFDVSNPFGYGAFLPRGLLRDGLEQLRRADALFVHGEGKLDLSAHTSAPCIGVKPKILRIVDAKSHKAVSLKRCKVGAFCAIAHPRRFLKSLHQAGCESVESWFLADHALPKAGALQEYARRCKRKGAEALLCTEKDAVKLFTKDLALPLYYLEMELEIISGQAVWDSLIEKIALKMNN